jgi:hypothetical protein
MTGRSDVKPLAVMVAVAALFAGTIYGWAMGYVSLGPAAPPRAAVTASPTPTAVHAPEIKIVHDTCCKQAARFLNARWESTERVLEAAFTLEPGPGFDCGATVDPSGLKGTFGCVGLLRGAVDHVGHLALTTTYGRYPVDHKFRTMGDKLDGVQWFTEFEDPTGDPLACAAASCRIIQLYTTGQDKMTATQVLQFGKQFNVSKDPGIDPVAIATILKRLDARNNYHYYRFNTREEATAAAVYWLFRSGKPVMAITLAGQHGPLVVGYQGTYGTYYDDPVNKITGVIVEDPQRGDMRQETANRRPDKYRSPDFQTGRLLPLSEWYGDEWWFGFAYQTTITYAGQTLNIERSDGAYPTPHWGGKFVLLVDDADPEQASDKEGRVKFH